MKRTIITIMLAMAIVIGASAQKTYVLLVGISSYGLPTEAGLIDLPPCAKEVKNLKKVFDQQKNTVTTVITGENATHENIVRKIDAIVKLATPQDKIIFVFSGHGGVSPELLRGFFACYKGEQFLYDELCIALSKSPTKEIICIIDACNSGVVQSTIQRMEPSAPTPVFITSSRGDQNSGTDSYMMTSYLIKALSKALRGKADSDGDKAITVMEAYKYAYNDVISHKKNSERQQYPQLIGPSSLYNTVITRW